MKTETYFEPAEVDIRTGQWHALIAVGVVSLAIVLLYWDTVISVVSIWRRSETYAHCFLVPAIVAWLIWRRRGELRQVELRPFAAPIVGVAVAGAIWSSATIAGVLGVSQFAVLFMLELAIIGIVGIPMTRRLLFPLAFAFFAVPAGEILVPTMIDWTADFTVEALRLTGVPVYREGNSFIIPSGHWSVVDACSGIRYLIASFMGGTIFAYLTYRSNARRLAFIAASVAFPIAANWFRAYLIVMLGHLTNNRVAVGVDHLIYGWILFGAIIILLFWVGSYWREVAPAGEVTQAQTALRRSVMPPRLANLWGVAALSIAVAALWPTVESALQRSVPNGEPRLLPLTEQGGWEVSSAPMSDWTPHYTGARTALHETFEASTGKVGVIVAYYRAQAQGNELISSGNTLVGGSSGRRWVQAASGKSGLTWNRARINVHTAELTDGATRLSVRYWFWVNGRITTSRLGAKLWLAHAKLTGQRDDSALVLLYTPKPDLEDGTDAVLEGFAAAMSPAIAQVLDQARASEK